MADVRIVLSAEDKTAAAIASARVGLQSMRPHIEAASVAMLGFGSVAGAAAASLAAFTASVRAIDSFNDLADATGASVENISALDRVARETGGNFDTISTSLIKFNSALKNTDGKDSAAAAALKAIGLSAQDLKNQDPAEALRQTAVALAGFADDGNKARLVQELFGKSLKEVAPYLKDLADQSALVAKTTTEEAQAAESFNKELFKLKANADDAARALSIGLVTSINETIALFREGAKEGKSFYSVLVGEQMRLLGLNDGPKEYASRIAEITEKLKDNNLHSSRRAQLLREQAALQATLATSPDFSPDNESSAELKRLTKRPTVNFTPPEKGKADKVIDLTKQQDSAIQGLSEKLLELTDNTTEYDKVVQRLATGTWKDFSANTKIALESIARVVDETKLAANQTKLSEAASTEEREKSRKAQLEYAQSTVEAMLAVSDYAAAIDDQNAAYAFEIGLMGKSESARRLALADYQIELDMKNQILAIDKAAGLTEEQRDSERERIRRAAATSKTGVRDLISAQDARLKDPTAGFSDGLAEYEKSVADVANNTRSLMVDAFKGMEDAMVSFVKTGKLDFKSMADSIISDLIRIAVQQSITGPLARAMMGSGSAGGVFDLFGDFGGAFFADGGVMSKAGSIPLHKYAGGGIASTPQLAVFGEGRLNEAFVPLPDGRSIPVSLSGGGSAAPIHFTIVNQTSAKFADISEQRNSDTERTLIIQEAKSQIAAELADPNSRMSRSMGRSYAVQRSR